MRITQSIPHNITDPNQLIEFNNARALTELFKETVMEFCGRSTSFPVMLLYKIGNIEYTTKQK